MNTRRRILAIAQGITAMVSLICFCSALVFSALGEPDNAVTMLLISFGAATVYLIRQGAHREVPYNRYDNNRRA